MSGYTKMEARSNSQFLVLLILLSVFFSQTLALPLETHSTMSLGNGMLFDGPNESDQNLGLLKVENDHRESSLPKNDLSFLYDPRALNRNRRYEEEDINELTKLLQDKSLRQLVKDVIGKIERFLDDEQIDFFELYINL